MLNDIVIIIRSVRERTEQLCKKLLLEQGAKEADIHIVREVPFSATMKKSYQIGIDSGKKWTICIDADMLLRPGAVAKMIEFGEKQTFEFCEMQGYQIDKYFGGVRRGGFHLYRSSLLPQVLSLVPEEGVSIRPETYTLKQMGKRGHPRVLIPYIVGTHDDEQYNIDIYRKAFVHAVKHINQAELLVNTWKKNATVDPDFKVALKAFSDSILTTEEVFINRDQKLYQTKFEEAGFEEKDELDPSKFHPNEIEERIVNWQADELYYKYYPTRDGLDSKQEDMKRRIRDSLKNRGVFETALVAVSQALQKAGKKIGSRVPE